MSVIACSIVSPEGELFSGEVEMLIADGGAGEVAITPRHAPLLTSLKPGPLRLTMEGGEEQVFYASGGFLEVQPGSITVLTDVAERAGDIDEAEAERAKELAEKELWYIEFEKQINIRKENSSQVRGLLFSLLKK